MRSLLAVLAVAGVIVGVALLVARHERFEWTTDSRTAVDRFEAGLEAGGKLYEDEAVAHLEAALEADPDFAAAQVYLVFYLSRHGEGDPRRIYRLLDELRDVDRDELTDRERTLVDFFLARARGDEDAGAVLEAYLEDHPDDPYILDFHCIELAFTQRHGEEAVECLQHLIAVDPNRTAAQNLLAYMALDEGDFARAEEQFAIYRFLAPGQANPHDSMAELLLVTGRYEEARDELRRALEIKPDFCPAWGNLVKVALLDTDVAAARRAVAQARRAGACDADHLHLLECTTGLWAGVTGQDWEAAWRALGECGAVPQEARPGLAGALRLGETVRGDAIAASLATLAALGSGRTDSARAVVRDLRGGRPPGAPDDIATLHSTGLVDLATGRPRQAAQSLAEVDRRIAWGGGVGTFKLINRLHLAAALAATGDDLAARQSMTDLADVNRPFALDPPLPTLHPVPAPVASPGETPEPAPAASDNSLEAKP